MQNFSLWNHHATGYDCQAKYCTVELDTLTLRLWDSSSSDLGLRKYVAKERIIFALVGVMFANMPTALSNN